MNNSRAVKLLMGHETSYEPWLDAYNTFTLNYFLSLYTQKVFRGRNTFYGPFDNLYTIVMNDLNFLYAWDPTHETI